LYSEALDELSPPEMYVMRTAWYGVASTGNQANVAVDRLWEKHREELPAAVGPLSAHRYMDDVESGSPSRAEVDRQVEQVTECLRRGGFKVKFVAHSGEDPPEVASSDGVSVGALGILWDTRYDYLGLAHKPMNLEKKIRGAKAPPKMDVTTPEGLQEAFSANLITRAGVLSRVAESYDPAGWYEPVKVNMKLWLSALNTLGWNDPVPADFHETWVRLFSFLEDSRDIKIPRCVKPVGTNGKARLLCLADAAEFAGGCAIYVGFEMPDGHYSCRLIYAKSRLMRHSIPRNELEAILMAAEASLVVQKALGDQVRDVFYYTDSSIALCWVLNDRKKLRMWCHNRVREITNAIRWVTGGVAAYPLYHIDGPSNLADLVTKPREICREDIDESSAWQTGLPWMCMPTDQLPRVQIVQPLKEEEVDVFDQVVFHDVFLMREAEDHQLLIGADPTSKSQPTLVHMLTLAHLKE
jgi:hypothetical protein